MKFKTGKLAPKAHPKTLLFDKYVSGMLPSPATKVYREYKTPPNAKQMYGNNLYGDCVFAMLSNYIILTTVHTGKIVIPTLDETLEAYSAVTGFDRLSGENDTGTAMTDALDYMVATGIAGVKFLGWAQIDHSNRDQRHLGVDLFGATLTGIQVPQDCQKQFTAGQSWKWTGHPGYDGHAILHPGYGRLGDDYVSWARWDQKASAEWSANVIDEEYVAITEAWIDQVTKKTPGGLDLDTLKNDLQLISSMGGTHGQL